MENPHELKDLHPIEPGPNPDMSWWSEGLFIVSIFPPLSPQILKLDYMFLPILAVLYPGVLFAMYFSLLVAKPSRLKNRLKAITLGTTLGTLVLIAYCMYN